MPQRYLCRMVIIITSVYITCAQEPVTEEFTTDESFNNEYTTITSYPTLEIHFDTDVQDINSYNKYETIETDSENATSFPPVFDVSQYVNECPPAQNDTRWPCEEQFTSWQEFQERGQELALDLCESFQDITKQMMYYSCYVAPSASESALNMSTKYEQKYADFLNSIANTKLEDRTQDFIDSIGTVKNMKLALNLSEEVRKGYMNMRSRINTVSVLQDDFGALNRSQVYTEIENEQTLLIEEMKSYVSKVKNLKMFLEQQKLTNVFYSGVLAQIADIPVEEGVLPNQLNHLQNIHKNLTLHQNMEILLVNARLAFVVIFLTLGMTGNLLLLVVFIKYKNMRTTANLMLINLTITDCMSLLINLPVAYYRSTNYWQDVWSCRIFYYIRNIVVIASTYSIVMISLQRFLAVKSFPKAGGCTIGIKTKTFLMVTSVWLLGFLYGIPRLMYSSIEYGMCADVNIDIVHILVTTDFILIFIVPSILIVVFSIITASFIKASVKNGPGERTGQEQVKKDRMLSANILTGLAVLFVVSYFPNFIFYFLSHTIRAKLDISTYYALDTSVYYLQFANACLNPVALAIMSKKYRKYYLEILACCKIIPLKMLESQSTSTTSMATTESTI
ncbi:hypothetical protein C0J52_02607 [Blattella germanica]|nr:hypothetical protein C0J52_02607 [Blattella germanica]